MASARADRTGPNRAAIHSSTPRLRDGKRRNSLRVMMGPGRRTLERCTGRRLPQGESSTGWPATKMFLFPPWLPSFQPDDEDICRIEISRPPHRRRGTGWLWKIHADLPAETLAGNAPDQGVLQRMELVGHRQ